MRSDLKLIALIIVVSLIPAWLFNRYMQHLIQPRRSFSQLLLYILVILVFVGGYTFGVVWLVIYLFPGLRPKA